MPRPVHHTALKRGLSSTRHSRAVEHEAFAPTALGPFATATLTRSGPKRWDGHGSEHALPFGAPCGKPNELQKSGRGRATGHWQGCRLANVWPKPRRGGQRMHSYARVPLVRRPKGRWLGMSGRRPDASAVREQRGAVCQRRPVGLATTSAKRPSTRFRAEASGRTPRRANPASCRSVSVTPRGTFSLCCPCGA